MKLLTAALTHSTVDYHYTVEMEQGEGHLALGAEFQGRQPGHTARVIAFQTGWSKGPTPNRQTCYIREFKIVQPPDLIL